MLRIGIDLGGTNIAAGAVDGDGKIIAKASMPTLAKRPTEEIAADMSKTEIAIVTLHNDAGIIGAAML